MDATTAFLILAIFGGVASLIAILTAATGVGRTVGKIRQRATTKKAAFSKDRFRLPSTGYCETRFPIEYEVAGLEARAVPGAVAKGEGLVVCFQDHERSEQGMGVWLTVLNPSQRTYRWFGCTLIAYALPEYAEIHPELHEIGGHLIFDLYPGDQNTCFYFFPFSPDVLGPKFLKGNSWDKELTFWWARGA